MDWSAFPAKIGHGVCRTSHRSHVDKNTPGQAKQNIGALLIDPKENNPYAVLASAPAGTDAPLRPARCLRTNAQARRHAGMNHR